jgi:hypothetical protein
MQLVSLHAAFILASTAVVGHAAHASAQEPEPATQMCGDGTTFTVQLPMLVGHGAGLSDEVTIPNGCRIYALFVSGYMANRDLDQLMFYKLAKLVAENDGYVHWAWWNNLLKEYLARPLHGLPGPAPQPTPGNLAGTHALGFVPTDLPGGVPKAVPEDDFQFQSDAKFMLKEIRQRNPDALIIVAGHSMGGNAVVRLGSDPTVPIDLLAPIDPVGNRSLPIGLPQVAGDVFAGLGGLLRTFNWNRWRVANEMLGWRQRDCVRNSLGLCQDMDPRPFRISFQCINGPLLQSPPRVLGVLVGSRAPLVCPQIFPEAVSRRPHIGANVRHFYHRWQQEFLFPFDFNSSAPISRGKLSSDILGPNYQAAVLENGAGIQDRNKTCGVGPVDRALAAAQALLGLIPEGGDQPTDPRDNSLTCGGFDGHGEIIGLRTRQPYGLTAGVTDPSRNWMELGYDAAKRREILVEMGSAPGPDPHKTVWGPHNWQYEPDNPHLDLVVDDMIDIVTFLLETGPPPPPTDDETAPESDATATPEPTSHGWNNTDVTVSVTASDEPDGSGVKEIEYSLAGSQSGSGVQAGAAADIVITEEGTTTLTFFARDNAGNAEEPQTLTIHVDKTPPIVLAEVSPEANAAGWHNTNVVVTFSGQDELSGIATVDPAVVLSAEGADQEVSGVATDRAGNTAFAAAQISIDKTPPVIAGLPGSCVLWPPNGRLVDVGHVVAADALSGVEPGSLSVTGTSSEPTAGSGRNRNEPAIVINGPVIQLRASRAGNGSGQTYELRASVSDRAGNSTAGSAVCTVPHDQRR